MDADVPTGDDFRVVQVTPPGSPASVAFGTAEARIGAEDSDWPDWYARYMASEQAGSELPT